jgi:hypothetical protein
MEMFLMRKTTQTLAPAHDIDHFVVRFEVFNGSDYEEWRLLGRYAVWLL